ncbi:Hypothetical predicted protein [Cloeon dipterum]|uniref:Uncharacterized protein n=1 Tax=Cloeon dipterum TaxID=197152 RepID=A0A8S1DXP5_9INSE|nr:Hypothetical predicted protein [Cloeon dipterum]
MRSRETRDVWCTSLRGSPREAPLHSEAGSKLQLTKLNVRECCCIAVFGFKSSFIVCHVTRAEFRLDKLCAKTRDGRRACQAASQA